MPSDCPYGFTPLTGDIAGPGLEYKDAVSLEQCASYCNLRSDCKSFVHSATHKHCKLIYGNLPTDGKYQDYQFCSKNKGNLSI